MRASTIGRKCANRNVRVVEALERRVLLSVTEPNDTLGSAYAVDGLRDFGGLETFADSISPTDQRDFYRISLPGLQNVFTARLYNLQADLQLALIRDTNKNGTIEPDELLKISVNAGTSEEVISQTLTQSDAYYVEVYTAASTNSSAYSLDLLADTAASTPQFTRTLPGHGQYTVQERLDSTSDLYDVYRLSTETPLPVFSLHLDADNASNYHVDLLQDINGNNQFDPGELITTSKPVPLSQEIAARTLDSNSKGFFYLRVLHSSPATDNYYLHISFDNAGDTVATARDIGGVERHIAADVDAVGSATAAGYHDPDDYYKFSITNDGVTLYRTLSAYGEFDPNVQFTYEIFRDANLNGVKDVGEVVASGTTTALGGGGSSSVVLPGTYYAHVSGGPWGTYRLILNGDTVPGIVGSNKFSDSQNSGTANGKRTYAESLGANDYSDSYRLDFPRAGSVIIAARNINTSDILTTTVAVDSNKNGTLDAGEILGSFTGNTTGRVTVPSGFVYVTISAPTPAIVYEYELDVTPDFAGDTPGTARNIGTLGSGAFVQADDHTSRASVGFTLDDPDYYKFAVTGSQTFTASLFAYSTDTDCDIVLYQDNAGTLTQLQRVSGAGGVKQLQRTIPAGNYQLEILDTDTDFAESDYSLGFSTGDNDDQIAEIDLQPNTHWIPAGGGKDLTLGDAADVDLVRVSSETTFGHILTLDVDSRNGSSVDTYLRVFDSSGKQLAANDNGTAPGEAASGFSYLEFRVPISGIYYVGISSKGNANYSAVSGAGDAGGSSTGQCRLNITDITGTPGSIAGTVFNDTNGNGGNDAGESGLVNRDVFIDLDGDGLWGDSEPGTHTDAAGAYKLSSIPPGTYNLRERVPAGWTQTSPAGGAPLTVTVGNAQNVTGKNFGVRQGSANTASIAGTIYNDVNGNGSLQAGETGIAGRTVFIDANGNNNLDSSETRVTTDSNGNYKFSNLAAGTFKVREVVPGGWTQSNPTSNASISVTVAAAQAATGKNFLTRPNSTGTGSIAGTVYNDLNGNGSLQAGETGIAGRTVFIDLNSNNNLDTNEQRLITDSNGNYKFVNLGTGAFKVREVIPGGWTQTNPASNASISITLAAAQAATGKNFFTKPNAAGTGSISGFVYNDLNGNGSLQTGEPGVGNRIVFIDANGNNTLDTNEVRVVTASNGAYTIANLGTGTLKVHQVVPGGWTQTSPASNGSISVTLTAGQKVTGKNFFARQTNASIAGNVFQDLNRNGVKDTGDTNLSAWTVYIDANGNNVLDSNEVRVTTDGSGNYKLSNLAAGTYKVKIMLKSGFVQTLPKSNAAISVTVSAGQALTGKNFGADN